MSNQEKLFRHDFRPVFRSLPSQPDWRPLRSACQFIVRPRAPGSPLRDSHHASYYRDEDDDDGQPRDPFAIQFAHKVEKAGETLYFAFCCA